MKPATIATAVAGVFLFFVRLVGRWWSLAHGDGRHHQAIFAMLEKASLISGFFKHLTRAGDSTGIGVLAGFDP